jgi:hypothetical protein
MRFMARTNSVNIQVTNGKQHQTALTQQMGKSGLALIIG